MSEELLARLRKAVEHLPSGQNLIQILKTEDESQLPLALIDAITITVEEAKSYSSSCKGDSQADVRTSLSDAAGVIKQCSFVVPRGKHTLAFFSDSLLIQTNKSEIRVPYKAILKVIIIDKIPKDTKERIFIYLHLDNEMQIMNGKVALSAVVIQLGQGQEFDVSNPVAPDQRFSGPAAVVLCQILGSVGVSGNMFSSPDTSYFSSSEGMYTGVEAYIKARQGYLYPLPTGICFLESPATFIPLEKIKAVELARASGASTTFDLYVHCCLKTGTTSTVEFSNISRNEISSIEGWIRAVGVSIGPTASSVDESGGETDVSGSTTSDDRDDEDFAPSESESYDYSSKRRKRTKVVHGTLDEQLELEGKQVNHEGTDDSSLSTSSDDESSSVELVSEDDFSIGALNDMIHKEKEKNHDRTSD